jgi:multimeric flavodoxin WrbA
MLLSPIINGKGELEEEAIMKSSKGVLGIVASPRNSGNTAILVKEVLKGAEEKGYETDLKCLGDLKINPLVASTSDKQSVWSSYSNKPYGVTDLKDDMELIYPSLEKMGVFVFGTPIYFDHVSARAKTFIDRLIYYERKSTKNRFPKNVRAVIILTYEWDKPEAYGSVVEWIKHTLEEYFKMKVVASLQAENTMKNPVVNREDLLKKTRQIGRNL